MSKGQKTSESDRASQNAKLRQVYRAHVARVNGYLLYRLGGRRAVAEELTQEVFLAYVAAVKSGVIIDDPRGWLITVARNHMVAYFRRAERRAVALPPCPAPDDLALTNDMLSALGMLEGLPPAQRLAMTLRYIDDLPVADVAEAIGRTVAATESLLARARRSVKELQR